MNPTRETKEITTPQGHRVVINTYLTGRERRDMQSIFLKDTAINGKSGEMEISNFKGSTITEANDFLLKTLIVSLNGDASNAFDRVLDLHGDEYEFIKNEIDALSRDWNVKKN